MGSQRIVADRVTSLNPVDSVTPKQTEMGHVSWQKVPSSLPERW